MRNYPTLNTSIPELLLIPLQEKHVPFLVKLHSSKEIQATLFRTPTKITAEKEAKALDRMYLGDKAKEITYILALKKFLSKTPIGYVKIKIIDWTVKSCYISVAILPDATYRGKGYAKATYDAFFEFLFSLGFMKVYGRTYETNTETIKLNERTGFKLIGRQQSFILYPNKTSLDALLFEKLNPQLEIEYRKVYADELEAITRIFSDIPRARSKNELTKTLVNNIKDETEKVDLQKLPSPLRKFIEETLTELTSETEKGTKPLTYSITGPFNEYRKNAAKQFGLEILSFPLTSKQIIAALEAQQELVDVIEKGTYSDISLQNSLNYGAYTKDNWTYLAPLFLGKKNNQNIFKLIAALREDQKSKPE